MDEDESLADAEAKILADVLNDSKDLPLELAEALSEPELPVPDIDDTDDTED